MAHNRLYLVVMLALMIFGFGAVWAYTLNDREAFLDSDYAQWVVKLEAQRTCRLGEVALIGDSRAAAGYIPKLAAYGGQNLALSGTTPVESFYQVQSLLACPNPPKTILIGFSPLQFEQEIWVWRHGVSYGLLDFGDLQQIAAESRRLGLRDLYGGAFGSEPPPTIKNWLYAHHFPPFDFAAILAARGGNRLADNRRIERETRQSDGQHVIGVPGRCANTPGSEADRSVFRPHPLIAIYFDRMLDLLHRHRTKAIFMPTVISRMTAAHIDARYVAGYNAYLAEIRNAHPEIVFAGPPILVADDCDFGDPQHLNQAGAERFSRRIAPVLHAAMTAPAIAG